MPLRDHFHPPLSVERPWEGIHGAWATTLATRLNRDLLPPDYFAMPLVTVGGQVEVDVATFEGESVQAGNGALATAVYAPPKPARTASVDFLSLPTYEVQILRTLGGPQLRAAIELVSPANKDRASHRRALATKCAAYLQQGVSVVLVDVVTERVANLHEELRLTLQLPKVFAWHSPTELYAVAYRSSRQADRETLDAWTEALQLGQSLPSLPLWLAGDLCLPLPLEETYEATCAALRISP